MREPFNAAELKNRLDPVLEDLWHLTFLLRAAAHRADRIRTQLLDELRQYGLREREGEAREDE